MLDGATIEVFLRPFLALNHGTTSSKLSLRSKDMLRDVEVDIGINDQDRWAEAGNMWTLTVFIHFLEDLPQLIFMFFVKQTFN